MSDERLPAWDQELVQSGSVTLKPSRWKIALFLLGTLMFTAPGVGMLVGAGGNRGALVVGIVTVGFFGVLGIPSLVVQFIKAGSGVVIDHRGVHLPRKKTVPWDRIEEVGIMQVNGTRMVALIVDPGFMRHALEHRPAWSRLLAGAERSIVGTDALFLPATIPVDTDVLATWLGRQAELHHQRAARTF